MAIEKEYGFDTEDGRKTLAEEFRPVDVYIPGRPDDPRRPSDPPDGVVAHYDRRFIPTT